MSVYDFKWQTASLIFQVAILRDRERTQAGFQLSVTADVRQPWTNPHDLYFEYLIIRFDYLIIPFDYWIIG